MSKRCIVIGASAGGFEVLRQVVAQLPVDLPAPVFIVLHVAAHAPGLLANILDRSGSMTALFPADGVAIEPGVIYVAPPDHHLLIDDGRVAVKRGPKENGFRPSIDTLFRSAALSCGSGAIGVVLSGALNDGTSGLWSIKRRGGIAIVQDPHEAQVPSMPTSALQYVDIDYTAPAEEIGALLTRLAAEPVEREVPIGNGLEEEVLRLATEVHIAAGQDVPQEDVLNLGPLTPFTCPECRGVLARITEGKLARYRCHTGHAFSEAALLATLSESLGTLLWQVTRGFQEAVMLLKHMGQHSQTLGDSDRAASFLKRARAIDEQARRLHQMAIEQHDLGGMDSEPPSLTKSK